jgi:predicted cobalt transporter CbtA
MSRFLRAGALAGAAGGLVMAVILRMLGEGPIGDAVAIEASHESMHDELYTRATQHIGGMIGVILYGVFVGVILAVVLAAIRHRLPLRDDWARSIVLSAIGFGTIVLVPFLKYPANPPTVGDPATITRRTVLYLAMVAFSIGATVLTWRVASFASSRWARPRAVPAAVLLYVVAIGTAFAAFPPFTDTVPLSATLMWRFRLDSLAGQAGLWSVLGLTLGGLLSTRPVPRGEAELVTTHG